MKKTVLRNGEHFYSMRLNKYLAECGVCSRREADKLIDMGKVQVNGVTASVGTQVEDSDVVMVNHKPVKRQEDKVVLAYFKPVGVTCTERDKNAEKTIIEALHYPVRVTYAGRLDKDSEGLMIMTNDGDLIEGMMRGANRHEKEYVVKVSKDITEEFLDSLRKGVYLKELNQTTRPCEVTRIGKNTFRIVLTQGLNRQIRRMCDTFGYQVHSLKRVRIMNIQLGDLKTGDYRVIQGRERDELYRAVFGNKGQKK